MELDAQPHYPVAGEVITDTATFSLIPEGIKPKDTTVLFVHAHPDDEASSTGATIGALTDAGVTVHLLTMTRGEMGEVIDPALRHLEATHPANIDRGHALGEYRAGELKASLKALGVRRHLYLGEGASYLPGERTSYRDSGMTDALSLTPPQPMTALRVCPSSPRQTPSPALSVKSGRTLSSPTTRTAATGTPTTNEPTKLPWRPSAP